MSKGLRYLPRDIEPSSQHGASQDGTRQAPQQSSTSRLIRQTSVTNTSAESFALRHYSFDGPGDAPAGHRSPSAARRRRANRTKDDTSSDQPTRRCSSENESSEHDSSPPQIPRTQSARPLRQTNPKWQLSDAILIPARRPSDQPLPFPSERPWNEYFSDDTVANYRAIGAQYQAWIAGLTTTECPIQRSKITWADLVDHPIEEHSFDVCLNELRSTPEEVGNIESTGLSMGNNWRYVLLRRYQYWDHGRQQGETVYQHRTGLGAIFVENIARRFGPYWAQVAQAQYQLDNHVDTLRYVYFLNVQNLYTWPYVELHLYPRHGLDWFDNPEPQCWKYGTREYQELLGTKLGRGWLVWFWGLGREAHIVSMQFTHGLFSEIYR
ncbi:uncharacterized protein N7479_008465 [Penicillium vulpinum]|uniref:uncharacterized protein n=1 Tax=Penicillium vulpinum TaxID=29845 RepID=UPI002549A4D2|nr:uncharacterized protein N7479_008465 [Penicillium vulpinum]KAJ5961315.1 hypothetical protein N7479_008465 [Penicillium vulpinum]